MMSNDFLRVFLCTVDKYKELTCYTPGKKHDLLDECSDEEFGSIQIKLMFLRKYVSDNTRDVHLRNILKRIDDNYPSRKEETQQLLERLESLNQSEMRTFLSNGKALNLRKVFELEAYGLLLHADGEKFEELIAIDEQILRLNIRKYVEDCEELVLDTAALVGTLNVPELVIPEKTRAEVISISNPDHIQQEIKKSPHWANLLGRDAKDGEAFQVFATLDEESQTAILTAMTFIGLLDQEPLNINALKEMVASETLKEWGDFEEAQLYIKNWANEGLNFRVRFSKTHNVAHVLIFDYVDSGFILQSYQVVRAYVMTLVKSPDRKYWLVHSFSNELVEQMNMREFLKHCFGKVKNMIKMEQS